ncbi:nitrate reductase subunit alpha [Litchfieldella xinjiangensis]|uniref:nitrate reductase subunit alpha n=1 Tax=Litchfieldella xinjiangensis TaxID=1166948 RepID=UPI0005BA27E4|nr:nitrate reductase subunit alpha [Halomonas xinjiangensis]
MSHFIDRLNFFRKAREPFANDHGEVRGESREWENGYRQRWQHDKIVRSTHGVNCTGSCSWKIYVKNGLVTWETQQTDYPRTRPDLPNHEPRGCPRGASYSWYIYSANRLKHPLIRKPLLKLWREALEAKGDPVDAWASIVEDPAKSKQYKRARGMGGFVRANWDELNELIAASNVYTAKQYGPDRIIGFSPIPAMSMVSYAAGSRYLSLIGGVCMSFYDWYCDLPPASPMTWGEQTDVPESADWYNSGYIIAWGSNVPQTRTPDAHFFTEVRYKGTKTVSITPDYAEVSKLTDEWLSAKQGTDAALAMAMGHVILKEFHLDKPSSYFTDYVRRYTDMPFLVELEPREDGSYAPGRQMRASDFEASLGQGNNPEWKTVAWDETRDQLVVPRGSIGFRWGEESGGESGGEGEKARGKWNLEPLDADGTEIKPLLSLAEQHDDIAKVAFPYFGAIAHEHFDHVKSGGASDELLFHSLPAKRLRKADGSDVLAVTVFDLMCANYGIDRGFGAEGEDDGATSYDQVKPYTPAWQEKITGVPAEQATRIAREFADNADKTQGRSMIIVGAGMNHWYHMDMNYRGLINMLVMCGCIGQSGGGWAHYVGQEKLRPQTGWTPLAFGLDWQRPPRHMNSTSFFYNHSSQWRYEKLEIKEILSPLAKIEDYPGSLIDFNVRSERMGWLPSAPQLATNPLRLAAKAEAAGMSTKDYAVQQLKSGELAFAAEDPDNPQNFPRNMFIWRSNLLGSSGKGHEYMLKYLLGTRHGIQGKDLGEEGGSKPQEVKWHDEAPEGKLDLLVTLDFRMSTTCLYSDIVLPTATWYEKDDLNTSDMHPFIHPLTAATDPAWESRSDWEIYKGIAKAFSKVCVGHLGEETDLVTLPHQHDSPAELAQVEVKDWKKGECEPIPGKTMPALIEVKRNYPETYERFTSVGPLLESIGNGGKGISWNTEKEVKLLGDLNHRKLDGPHKGRPQIESAIDAAEMILTLAPETNGQVAVKAWGALSKITGRDHTHLAHPKEEEKIRFRDIVAQPRKIISSPTWSGLEDEHVSYNAGYTNVHELIPWRTVSGRQQFYQDHPWMRAFGESLLVYRPPIDTKAAVSMAGPKGNGNPEIALNWITPHQKWGIHSTYSDNLLMQTLSRGGPIVWMSEDDAGAIGVEDNDWIELYNANGAIAARAVVSQRVKNGMVMMYHAQERIVNIPGSEITGTRGGIHNSVTRVCPKPTHMIGGYAQLSYSFNYYGTVGSNRDEFVIVRKMKRIDWLDGEGNDYEQEAVK